MPFLYGLNVRSMILSLISSLALSLLNSISTLYLIYNAPEGSPFKDAPSDCFFRPSYPIPTAWRRLHNVCGNEPRSQAAPKGNCLFMYTGVFMCVFRRWYVDNSALGSQEKLSRVKTWVTAFSERVSRFRLAGVSHPLVHLWAISR